MTTEKSLRKNIAIPDQVIICPNCQTKIPLTEAISHQIREKMHKEFDAEFLKKEKEFKEKFEKEAKQKAEEAIAVDLEDLRGQISEKDKKLKEAQKAELDLRKQKRELEESKKKFELEKAKKHEELEAEFLKKEKEFKEKFEKEAKQKAEEAIAVDLEDLRGQISEKDKKLKEAQKAELDLRKQKRELEESKRNFELEMAKKLDEERENIRNTTLELAMEEHRLKDLEKDEKITGMIKQIDDLKRKAQQGSQQTQGEAIEQELEKILRANFPLDRIEPVPKGIRGADVLQKIYDQSGICCGTIIWESKNAKVWKDSWIAKLKDDKSAVGADVAVLMTTTLPNEVKSFAHYKGAWVTNYTSRVGLATALRLNLIQVATMKLATEGKHSKMEVLYNYLSGSEFRQKVEAIVEAFEYMKTDLDKEKKAMMGIWSKREKQIERVVFNTATMYGDMQGIMGASMPQINSLELKALPSGIDFSESNYDEKDEILEPKIPNEEATDEQINTQFIKEKSSKTNEEISEPIEDLDNDEILKPEIPNEEATEDLDEDELKIYNCLKEDFSGEAENGDIAIKLRMGPVLVANRFNRLKSKGLVTETKEDEGGIKWTIK
ncbi:MAG: DUF2130 domain-containing protein [Candidatus Methanoperedens sp.]